MQISQDRFDGRLALRGAVRELPYDLAEMPDIYEALLPYDPVAFLESREGTEKYARYGITAARPLLRLVGKGTRFDVEDRTGRRTSVQVRDPLDLLRELEPEVELPAGLDSFRFAGGWLGTLGYEACGLLEYIPPAEADDLDLPDVVFYLPSVLVLKDAAKKRLTLLCLHGDRPGAERLCGEVAAHLEGMSSGGGRRPDTVMRSARCSFSEDGFLRAVEESRRLIHGGELIQVVLSRRWEVDPAPDPMDVYRALSRLNPSPYHFFLRLPDGVLFGASPELLVRREDQVLTVRPIAGTRKRGSHEGEDRALAEEMMADPKERAEHIMLVDLGRNDLGRVSEPGSVEVTRRMIVEKYSHVMHLVSEVRSRIARECDSYDVLRSCFPAGTVSGAPKVRAMQVVAELEPVIRGPYAGGVGYFDTRGNMDFCITIRSIFYSGHRAFIQSGAGIVADSVPVRERDEIAAKAAAMFRAFGEVRFQAESTQDPVPGTREEREQGS
ncbi:MAG: anthranilate synthase component I family protein [bacterium]|nr:MAG: anthranilate synthase component I family protein [bacterium]